MKKRRVGPRMRLEWMNSLGMRLGPGNKASLVRFNI